MAVGVLIAMGALVVSVRAPSALGVVSVVVRVGIIGCTHDRGCTCGVGCSRIGGIRWIFTVIVYRARSTIRGEVKVSGQGHHQAQS